MLILIVAGGPDKGRIYELFDDREVVLGREGADIQLNDPKVSRRHARLWSEGGRWYVLDLESRHGTHRNHQPIDEVQPLKDGDYIQVGRTVMVLARMASTSDERAALLSGASPTAGRFKTRHLVAGLAAAAVVMLGLNVAMLVTSTRGVGQLQQELLTLNDQTTQSGKHIAEQISLTQRVTEKQQHEIRNMIASFQPSQERLIPKLDTILAAIDAQPDVAGPLAALAQAIEQRDDNEQITKKMDAALALLKERGGNAEDLADQFRELLAAQPTVEQIAAATAQRNDQTVAVLTSLAAKLDERGSVGKELEELRRLIEQRPQDGNDQELKPLLQQVLARVENLDPAQDTQTVLTAIAEVKSALPADNSAKLDAMLARIDSQSTGQELAAVNQQLARLNAELQDRSDTQLIQAQLAALVEAQQNAPTDEANALEDTDDPLLGQVLAQLDALSNTDRKLDAIYASLQNQPYRNRAMLDEALAQIGTRDEPTEKVVAEMLDNAMAELRGQSITDADELRRLIQREVVAAVGRASGERIDRGDDDTRLTKTEQAYKRAFESGRRIIIGANVIDPATGRRARGRTLDPAMAHASGYKSWRDWYLMDDLADRVRTETQADRFADNKARPGVVRLPGEDQADGLDTVHINAATPPAGE